MRPFLPHSSARRAALALLLTLCLGACAVLGGVLLTGSGGIAAAFQGATATPTPGTYGPIVTAPPADAGLSLIHI